MSFIEVFSYYSECPLSEVLLYWQWYNSSMTRSFGMLQEALVRVLEAQLPLNGREEEE